MTTQRLENVLSGKLLPAICILYTITAALQLLARTLPVFPILYCISLWLIYNTVRKPSDSLAEHGVGLKLLSGSVKAGLILEWVITGIFAAAGIAMFILALAAGSAHEVLADTVYSFATKLYPNSSIEYFSFSSPFGQHSIDLLDRAELTPDALRLIFCRIGAVLLSFAALFTLFIVFYFRNLRKFTKSICVSFESGVYCVESLGAVKGWFMAFGIINGLAFLGGGILPGCNAALSFLLFALCKSIEAEEYRALLEPAVRTDEAEG